MNKKLILLLVVIMLLASASISALAAKPAPNASGTWTYAPVSYTDVLKGCNLFRYMTDEGTFTGTFEGTETEVGLVRRHCNGKWSYKGNLIFDGIVNGDSGTLEMRIVGKSDNFTEWHGTWVILSGTDELQRLHGKGTWEGAPGDLTYQGNIHFAPRK